MLQTYSASVARDRFAELRRAALKGQEILIEDGKKNSSPLISLISTEILDSMTDKFSFSPVWTQDEDGGYTVSIDEIDIIGYGDTRDEAAEVLATAVFEYAGLYFTELDFYRSLLVNRGSHYPYLRRISRCQGNLAAVKQVLGV